LSFASRSSLGAGGLRSSGGCSSWRALLMVWPSAAKAPPWKIAPFRYCDLSNLIPHGRRQGSAAMGLARPRRVFVHEQSSRQRPLREP
jgi:hypothetical protein